MRMAYTTVVHDNSLMSTRKIISFNLATMKTSAWNADASCSYIIVYDHYTLYMFALRLYAVVSIQTTYICYFFLQSSCDQDVICSLKTISPTDTTLL